MSDDCGQDDVCAEAPGCSRHWAERVREVMSERDVAMAATVNAALIHADLVRERDEARDELAKTSADFHDVWESRDKVIEERERARQACNAYWHDLTRIALLCAQTDDEYPLKAVERTVRERDEALAQVARREREHEALLETAQKALARVEAERDGAKAEAERMRDERDYWERRFEYADTHLSEAFNLSPMDNLPSGEAKRIVDLLRTERDDAAKLRAELASARAEIEMLRGVGCREAKLDEPESGPCGVCLRCAEERGAKWALAQAHREVCFAVDQERAGINVRRLTGWEICRDARRER